MESDTKMEGSKFSSEDLSQGHRWSMAALVVSERGLTFGTQL